MQHVGILENVYNVYLSRYLATEYMMGRFQGMRSKLTCQKSCTQYDCTCRNTAADVRAIFLSFLRKKYRYEDST